MRRSSGRRLIYFDNKAFSVLEFCVVFLFVIEVVISQIFEQILCLIGEHTIWDMTEADGILPHNLNKTPTATPQHTRTA